MILAFPFFSNSRIKVLFPIQITLTALRSIMSEAISAHAGSKFLAMDRDVETLEWVDAIDVSSETFKIL